MLDTKFINFRGYELNRDQILCIDPVKSYLTGSLNCDWSYGFTIRFSGNQVDVLIDPPRGFGHHVGPSEQLYLHKANMVRDEL